MGEQVQMNMNHFIFHRSNMLLVCSYAVCIYAVSCFVNVVSAATINKGITELKAPLIKVAIVIDDIGYRYTDKQTLLLPGDVTYSILPQTVYGKKIALQAFQQHKDVLLHIPMESENGKRLGPGALTKDMSQNDVHLSLEKSLNEIPFAIGINNHMGSYLTRSVVHMAWTMDFLKSHNLFFLDSKTSPYSKAKKVAQKMGVPVLERQVFLDNKLDMAYITKQFHQLILSAKKNKSAIAIAHPHPESMKALQALIPTLKDHNIELVPLSALYDENRASKNRLAKTETETETPLIHQEKVALTEKILLSHPVKVQAIVAQSIQVKAQVIPAFSAPSVEH